MHVVDLGYKNSQAPFRSLFDSSVAQVLRCPHTDPNQTLSRKVLADKMVKKAGKVPDAWEDDDWEAQADKAPAEEPEEADAGAPLTKNQG